MPNEGEQLPLNLDPQVDERALDQAARTTRGAMQRALTGVPITVNPREIARELTSAVRQAVAEGFRQGLSGAGQQTSRTITRGIGGPPGYTAPPVPGRGRVPRATAAPPAGQRPPPTTPPSPSSGAARRATGDASDAIEAQRLREATARADEATARAERARAQAEAAGHEATRRRVSAEAWTARRQNVAHPWNISQTPMPQLVQAQQQRAIDRRRMGQAQTTVYESMGPEGQGLYFPQRVASEQRARQAAAKREQQEQTRAEREAAIVRRIEQTPHGPAVERGSYTEYRERQTTTAAAQQRAQGYARQYRMEQGEPEPDSYEAYAARQREQAQQRQQQRAHQFRYGWENFGGLSAPEQQRYRRQFGMSGPPQGPLPPTVPPEPDDQGQGGRGGLLTLRRGLRFGLGAIGLPMGIGAWGATAFAEAENRAGLARTSRQSVTGGADANAFINSVYSATQGLGVLNSEAAQLAQQNARLAGSFKSTGDVTDRLRGQIEGARNLGISPEAMLGLQAPFIRAGALGDRGMPGVSETGFAAMVGGLQGETGLGQRTQDLIDALGGLTERLGTRQAAAVGPQQLGNLASFAGAVGRIPGLTNQNFQNILGGLDQAIANPQTPLAAWRSNGAAINQLQRAGLPVTAFNLGLQREQGASNLQSLGAMLGAGERGTADDLREQLKLAVPSLSYHEAARVFGNLMTQDQQGRWQLNMQNAQQMGIANASGQLYGGVTGASWISRATATGQPGAEESPLQVAQQFLKAGPDQTPETRQLAQLVKSGQVSSQQVTAEMRQYFQHGGGLPTSPEEQLNNNLVELSNNVRDLTAGVVKIITPITDIAATITGLTNKLPGGSGGPAGMIAGAGLTGAALLALVKGPGAIAKGGSAAFDYLLNGSRAAAAAPKVLTAAEPAAGPAAAPVSEAAGPGGELADLARAGGAGGNLANRFLRGGAPLRTAVRKAFPGVRPMPAPVSEGATGLLSRVGELAGRVTGPAAEAVRAIPGVARIAGPVGRAAGVAGKLSPIFDVVGAAFAGLDIAQQAKRTGNAPDYQNRLGLAGRLGGAFVGATLGAFAGGPGGAAAGAGFGEMLLNRPIQGLLGIAGPIDERIGQLLFGNRYQNTWAQRNNAAPTTPGLSDDQKKQQDAIQKLRSSLSSDQQAEFDKYISSGTDPQTAADLAKSIVSLRKGMTPEETSAFNRRLGEGINPQSAAKLAMGAQPTPTAPNAAPAKPSPTPAPTKAAPPSPPATLPAVPPKQSDSNVIGRPGQPTTEQRGFRLPAAQTTYGGDFWAGINGTQPPAPNAVGQTINQLTVTSMVIDQLRINTLSIASGGFGAGGAPGQTAQSLGVDQTRLATDQARAAQRNQLEQVAYNLTTGTAGGSSLLSPGAQGLLGGAGLFGGGAPGTATGGAAPSTAAGGGPPLLSPGAQALLGGGGGGPAGAGITNLSGTLGGVPTVTAPGQGQQAFINSLWPLAVAASQQTGLPPEAYLAIAANEYGWNNPGATANPGENRLFGETAAAGYAGPTHGYPDWEPDPTQPGGKRWFTNTFKTFPTANAAFASFNQLMATPRYAAAVAHYRQSGNLQQFFSELQAAGYAGDPNWVANMVNIAGTVRRLAPATTVSAPAGPPIPGSAPAAAPQAPDATAPAATPDPTQPRPSGLTDPTDRIAAMRSLRASVSPVPAGLLGATPPPGPGGLVDPTDLMTRLNTTATGESLGGYVQAYAGGRSTRVSFDPATVLIRDPWGGVQRVQLTPRTDQQLLGAEAGFANVG